MRRKIESAARQELTRRLWRMGKAQSLFGQCTVLGGSSRRPGDARRARGAVTAMLASSPAAFGRDRSIACRMSRIGGRQMMEPMAGAPRTRTNSLRPVPRAHLSANCRRVEDP
jgi:hypothetical protein